jgi:hypothetical protein
MIIVVKKREEKFDRMRRTSRENDVVLKSAVDVTGGDDVSPSYS